MDRVINVAASTLVVGSLVCVLLAHRIAAARAGHAFVDVRVEREQGLPLFGRAPMHAVYRALRPVASTLVTLGVGANSVTVASFVLAAVAGVAFACGHFGVGAAVACVAGLADAVDGLVARASPTGASRLGQVLDTVVDRYVDALLLGGVAVYFRSNVVLLVATLAAMVGSFMTSYASSLERELQGTATPGMLRRAHRIAYLIAAATTVPFVGIAPIVLAVALLAVLGNASAVRRVLAAVRAAERPSR